MSSKPASETPNQPVAPPTSPGGIAAQPTQAEAAAPDTPSLVFHAGFRPLPDYELVQHLGQGGFGQVWKAIGPGGFPVALKFIRLDGEATDAEVRSLEVMKEIRHPQLVHLVGAWRRDGYLIVAMELGDCTLFQRLQEAIKQGLPGIPRAELLECMRDAARGIDYLNSINIRHRDIKPQNFLLVGGGLKVADFGLAKLVENQLSSNSGAMTPAFAAPEFLEGRTSDRSDQYSLAVSYCQLRGGRLPFVGNQATVMLGHLEGTPDLSMLPEAERPIVARALAKKPEERWTTCREFADALAAIPEQQIPQGVSEAATLPPGTPPPVISPAPPTIPADWPVSARRPSVALMSAFLIIALIPVVLWAWPRPSSAESDLLSAEEESIPPAPDNLQSGIVNSLGMKLILVNRGSFTMGANSGAGGTRDDDGPAHEVRLTHPFYLAEHEVTQQQYENVMDVNPAHFNSSNGGGPDHPVEMVSWDNAVLFSKRLSALKPERGRIYRLPTEAEWEYACRAGAESAFSFGDAASSAQANFNGQAAKGPDLKRTAAAGSYPANPWGFHDVHGNVWEWCSDWSAPYDPAGAALVNPLGPRRGHGRVLRGGSWDTYGWTCRSTSRSCLPPACRANDVGFRIAFTPTETR